MEKLTIYFWKIINLPRRIKKQFWIFIANRGGCRFVINRWKSLIDINLAARVMESEYFRGEVSPLPLPAAKVASILVLAPHQDDEAIGAGGTLLIAAKGGADINVLYITDGAQHDSPLPADEYVRIRQIEADESCFFISGISHCLGISNTTPKPTIADIDNLTDIINRLQPDVIMLPWLLDVPPKHRLTNHLLWLSNQRNTLPGCEVWSYQIHNTLYPNGYVDITDVAEQKRKMIRCYRSQNENYKHYDSIAMGLAAWNARLVPARLDEGRDRFAEIFFTLPVAKYLELVAYFYFRDIEATYRNEANVFRGAQNIHRQIVGH